MKKNLGIQLQRSVCVQYCINHFVETGPSGTHVCFLLLGCRGAVVHGVRSIAQICSIYQVDLKKGNPAAKVHYQCVFDEGCTNAQGD